MRITKKLNLVVPVDEALYVHAMPISREVFERYFMVLAKTFSTIYGEGLGAMAGPRVAALTLKRVAADMGQSDEVEQGLFAEIRRLANAVYMTPAGWVTVPLTEAMSKKVIAADDLAQVENILCFFSCASQMHRPEELTPILGLVERLWGAQTTPFSLTEYRGSLPISTTDGNSGEAIKAA